MTDKLQELHENTGAMRMEQAFLTAMMEAIDAHTWRLVTPVKLHTRAKELFVEITTADKVGEVA